MLYCCIFIPIFGRVWRPNANLAMLHWKCIVLFLGIR